MKHGFSLVELSIVLVILGLLTGGILSGQALIRASELRSVSNDFSRYSAAVYTFRDKYFALPGDFRDATKFWGRTVNLASCATNSSAGVTTPGTCDGNGDNVFGISSGSGVSGEMWEFWNQLSRAGLIEGTYTGLAGSASWADAVLGSNVPAAKISSTGWSTQTTGSVGDGSFWTLGQNYNFMIFGSKSTSSLTHGPALKPEEAWNIDTKMDDGRPAYGKIIARYWNNACSAPDSGAAANTNFDASYRLTDSSSQCALYIKTN